ncbi:MAG: Asp-tRNA(Asn)/Glu-tRNA(Gln) amidotransferase subunit GatA [bacterium]|nr:Asp-tRNA(Asn)/Glu-tRNA(Gln) amidotransferase subunit GatA [bacterium]
MELNDLTITQISEKINKKELSALELCREYLKVIKKKNKDIFAFLSVDEEAAISKAKKMDEAISSGQDIPVLAGLPCAIKDNIMVEGFNCTAGSKILENYRAPYNATVVEKINKEGGIILGKTNLDEFAMGSSTENSAFGPTKNPHDLTRVPGGSSGGSAAAVAGGLSVFSLGSDTGGSIRLPSSFCGVVGLKPTYGAVSRHGLISFASSLDQIGPMAKTVEDCQTVFNVIKGKDKMDSTSVDMPEIQKSKEDSRDIKIGIPKEYFVKGMDPQVEGVIKKAIKRYEEMGVKIEEISLPHAEYALSCYYIIAPSEASTNLARYDGIKYGYSKAQDEAQDLLDVYLKSREEGFGEEVRRRIMLGTYALSAGYYDAYYLKAQKVRTLIKNDFEKVFKPGGVDAIFAPVSPFLPFKIGEKIKDPLSMYLVDIYTISVNLAGLPALSLPVGKVGNLPVGLQIIGKPFEEDKILKIGKLYEGNN